MKRMLGYVLYYLVAYPLQCIAIVFLLCAACVGMPADTIENLATRYMRLDQKRSYRSVPIDKIDIKEDIK